VWDSPQEIRCAIKWVDNPPPPAFTGRSALLSKPPVAGPSTQENVVDTGLRGKIGLAQKISRPLAGNLEVAPIRPQFRQHIAG
jgi:hypothetical protein